MESNSVETSILHGMMFEEPSIVPEEWPENDKGTWDDDMDELSHGQDDSGPIDNRDGLGEAEAEEPEIATKKGHYIPPPSVEETEKAFHDLGNILKPCRKKGYGFKDPGLDGIVMERLSNMKLFCYNYTQMQKEKPTSLQWGAASLHTEKSLGGNVYMA